VRLNRWKEKPGELSFVPPDGKFMLAGYEVDLLPYSFQDGTLPTRGSEGKLFLPATVDLRTGLGPSGMDFEAKLTLNTNYPGVPNSDSATSRPAGLGSRTTSAHHTPFTFPGIGQNSGTTAAPTLEAVSVTIPFPSDVRNVMDFRPSRGDAAFNLATKTVEWKIPTSNKDGSVSGTAILKGTIASPLDHNAEQPPDPTMDEYYPPPPTHAAGNVTPTAGRKGSKKHLLPRTISTSFTVKGWLPSGIKVDALAIDTKRSKRLGDGIKPYKGVKYLCISRKGVERRVALA